MALRDLIPWKDSSRNVAVQRSETGNPLLALHREMNRLFDEAFRSFDYQSVRLVRDDRLAQRRTQRNR
jgi:HSP20 family protein